MREEYVEKDGTPVDQLAKDKKKVRNTIIIVGVVISIVLFYFIFRNISRSSFCKKMINTVKNAALEYGKTKNELPVDEGAYIVYSLEDLRSGNVLSEALITVNKKIATGSAKITKYKEEYVVTVELKNCDYCDTSKKKWSKELTKRGKKPVEDVVAYYNYYHTTLNETDWTKWFRNEELSEDISKKYKIRLPKSSTALPRIASDTEVVTIEQETKEVYRYRDKKWRWYNGGGNYTDFFSSVAPEGFPTFDKQTLIYTEWSEFTLTYPEEKEYRMIEKKTGYKWYKQVKGKKEYYKNGEYFVDIDVPKEYQRDSKQTSFMYRYRDKQWRWYNGASRRYSSPSSIQPRTFPSRDDALLTYTSYSQWADASKMDASNSFYREEETETRYRYRIKYTFKSLPILKKEVTKELFEDELKQSLHEILSREDIKVDITYKFKYKS